MKKKACSIVSVKSTYRKKILCSNTKCNLGIWNLTKIQSIQTEVTGSLLKRLPSITALTWTIINIDIRSFLRRSMSHNTNSSLCLCCVHWWKMCGVIQLASVGTVNGWVLKGEKWGLVICGLASQRLHVEVHKSGQDKLRRCRTTVFSIYSAETETSHVN